MSAHATQGDHVHRSYFCSSFLPRREDSYIYIRLLETASKLILNAFVLAFKSLLAFEYEQINMVFDIRRVKTSH